jgi:hypothetical protein
MTTTGKCLCQAVTFECDELGPAGYCHCEDCRRCTGSAFNVSVRCAADGLRILSGELGSFTKNGDSGCELTRHFCQTCGSPVFTSSPRDPAVIYVKAGLLDDPEAVRPALQCWTRSKVAWADPPSWIDSFEKGRGSTAEGA